MSEWSVEVVEIGKVGKHPNADNLSITHVLGDYPVIFRTEEFQPGDRALYIPVDSVVPLSHPLFSWLKVKDTDDFIRIKAKRLRGIFSMGLIVPTVAPVGMKMAEDLGITKYIPPEEKACTGGENEHCPHFFPIYTDVEGFRKYGHVLKEGQEVVATEKIHGANGRWMYQDGRLWVGSHKTVKKEDTGTIWWRIAEQSNLEAILKNYPRMVFYGEVYGAVQKLRYGVLPGHIQVAFFDIYDIHAERYLDYREFKRLMENKKLPIAPVVGLGPWDPCMKRLAEGSSSLLGADHIREGIVIKPIKERYDFQIGRVILKLVSESYLLSGRS